MIRYLDVGSILPIRVRQSRMIRLCLELRLIGQAAESRIRRICRRCGQGGNDTLRPGSTTSTISANAVRFFRSLDRDTKEVARCGQRHEDGQFLGKRESKAARHDLLDLALSRRSPIVVLLLLKMLFDAAKLPDLRQVLDRRNVARSSSVSVRKCEHHREAVADRRVHSLFAVFDDDIQIAELLSPELFRLRLGVFEIRRQTASTANNARIASK